MLFGWILLDVRWESRRTFAVVRESAPSIQKPEPRKCTGEDFVPFSTRAFEIARAKNLNFVDERLFMLALLELSPRLSQKVLGVSEAQIFEMRAELERDIDSEGPDSDGRLSYV